MKKQDKALPADINDLLTGLGGMILESIRTPLGIFDKDFRILWINRSLARIHRCKAEEVVGAFCYQAFHGCDKVCHDCFLEEVKQQGRTVILERFHDFPGGKRRWGEIHAYPVRAKDKSIAAMVVIIFDTTQRNQTLKPHESYTRQLQNSALENGEDHVGDDSDYVREELSKRETQVLGLIVDGYTNPQISELLSISSNTVKRHISNIFIKLGVSDRTQAAVLAVRLNLLEN
ncbi:MAG: PAS domain-containing protein [Desulfobulbaceae bacterium]|nr:MAG: PAS domain-containing protein [Desulfobulbaceae bacterium]